MSDLDSIYRDALTSDPTLASARASWLATQENVPQARAGLLPSVAQIWGWLLLCSAWSRRAPASG